MRRTTLTTAAIASLAAIWLASCAPAAPQAVAGDNEPMLFPSDLRVSGPDQFGVVCYTFGSKAVSCVQIGEPKAAIH